MKTKVHMTNSATIKAGNLLGEKCLPVVGTKFFAYVPDYTDNRIAVECGQEGITENHIQRLRISLDMRFQPVRPSKPSDPALLDLIQRFNKLCDGLSVARVIDARHLKVDSVE